ncbi:MAG: hypothetical protein M1832_001004 [Thelocarpon impressellum]|nr:MAG: hypothetical protein M1832_001004 [Thelocarpon impressellum]
MSILEAQKLGRQLFGRKDYKAALEAFTEAIELSEEVDAGLFDNRAATSEKLGDLTAALRDGKAMIHLDKSDARGYLRTAKILQLMGKRDVALGIYKYGLKHVRSGDPHCEVRAPAPGN